MSILRSCLWKEGSGVFVIVIAVFPVFATAVNTVSSSSSSSSSCSWTSAHYSGVRADSVCRRWYFRTILKSTIFTTTTTTRDTFTISAVRKTDKTGVKTGGRACA